MQSTHLEFHFCFVLFLFIYLCFCHMVGSVVMLHVPTVGSGSVTVGVPVVHVWGSMPRR